MRRAFGSLALVALAAGAWEAYKALAPDDGVSVMGVRVMPRADDQAMPHLWTVLARLGEPELRGGAPIWEVLLSACLTTLGIVAVGLVVGVVVGGLLAVLMQRSGFAERGLLPYVVLSQTVPLVALAPAIAGWGGAIMPQWATVSVIAAYLAFFPVAVGLLRGLQSPPPEAVELMDAYSAGWWATLVKLRLPASLPFLFPALKLAGAAAVVGAVVGEISTGTRGGIGRLVIEYSREATTDPAKVYTAMLGAALLGLAVTGLLTLGQRLAARGVTP
ncbi:ABC transporter permease [Actinocorallia sp. A-T 12471]|uniref:ABC transporter permease n=1 Tax=Actinocorallia sp. A-T 12471 TaxID=3089813 RepID=UPI0029D1B3CA|nr:ABC transporter permease subunit [Actinocorallia sp. A-T 12471]MDX6739253.1 ABC transporter permease subunit [Actinocorallia sp. A-T 12471]